MSEQNLVSRKALRDKWQQKIQAAEKKYAEYYDLTTEIREYYRNARRRNKQNIFWATIETLKPFLYFKQPTVFVVRSRKTAGEVENLAATILERALYWNMKQFDFDSVVKYARNDFLLSGTGILWEQYNPTFYRVGSAFLKQREQVDTVYVSPMSFLCDTQQVDVWEDVSWIARKTCLDLNEVADNFAPAVAEYVAGRFGDSARITVYEIWDKPSKSIYYFSPEYPSDFLDVYEDTLHLTGFFPCPKPIMATLTNDGIIPVPDYVEIKSLLDELDGVNSRMRLTMQALKVSGCYDSSFPELANILDKDVTLIALSDFEKLKDAGGIGGIIDFAPIKQYIEALTALATRRQTLIDSIYEVTGVSDIMRGASQAKETATAVTQKTNFGTLRNQDRQNDMQRFLKDLLQIKAEIICEQFSPEFLLSFLNPDECSDMDKAVNAVKLLKSDKLRGMVINLETDGSFNPQQEEERTINVLKNVHQIISQAFGIVSQQPALLPLYRQMLESAVAAMPRARQFDVVMDAAFNKIEQELNEPEKPISAPDNPMIELQKQKNNQDFAIKQEQNAIRREELNLKKAETLAEINEKQSQTEGK
ncbi:MAG: hypothetical protein IJ218_02395 [Alphaproteobacteria bacterium]|nr:hypothetical protein [Alphaproteobacteria bacterium]